MLSVYYEQQNISVITRTSSHEVVSFICYKLSLVKQIKDYVNVGKNIHLFWEIATSVNQLLAILI